MLGSSQMCESVEPFRLLQLPTTQMCSWSGLPDYCNVNLTGNLVFADLWWFSLSRSDVEVHPGYGWCYMIKMVVMMALSLLPPPRLLRFPQCW